MEANAVPLRVKFFPSIWKSLERCGVPASEVLRRARMPAAALTETTMLTIEQSHAFWAAVRELSGNPAIGLEIARNIDLAGAPPIVLAPYHARNWRDAMHMVGRYKQMCAPERLHFREEGDSCTIDLEWLQEHPERATATDLMFGILMELGRRGTGQPVRARHVELQWAQGNPAAHAEFFGATVRFGAASNRLVVDRADLDRPFASYNRELLEVLSPALERALADHHAGQRLADRVKWLMKRRLATSRPEMRAIAQELAMSERTLQRRLADEGTRFLDVLTTARRELAHEYLVNGQLDMVDVAFLLGFDDQNSFFRAFRQWEGETPARWRALRVAAQPLPGARREPTAAAAH
ncbi:MAG TPA: AraC family transcriptional regulator ligand-binding domain-containing protein [Usitatibacter sp.]|jgi:AraC-like DNA-binding protein|nr:AraC family transcriptional regulator ligand-binding domain-containing protein [Usitatibacter sp.]